MSASTRAISRPLSHHRHRTCAARGGSTRLPSSRACLRRRRARSCSSATRPASSGAFLALAERLVVAARTCAARRSSSTIAPTSRALAGAAGVHVGQDDLPVDDVRPIVGAGGDRRALDARRRGRSTRRCAATATLHRRRADLRHGDQGHRLRPRAGSIWCATRPDAGSPVVAIGGITLERAPAVVEAGASRGRGHLRSADGGDPEAASTREFLARLSRT